MQSNCCPLNLPRDCFAGFFTIRVHKLCHTAPSLTTNMSRVTTTSAWSIATHKGTIRYMLKQPRQDLIDGNKVNRSSPFTTAGQRLLTERVQVTVIIQILKLFKHLTNFLNSKKHQMAFEDACNGNEVQKKLKRSNILTSTAMSFTGSTAQRAYALAYF